MSRWICLLRSHASQRRNSLVFIKWKRTETTICSVMSVWSVQPCAFSHLLSASSPFHDLFSLFLIQHLSISPRLFISLPRRAWMLECVHWSGCYSLKVAFHSVSFLFCGCLCLPKCSCCRNAWVSLLRCFLLGLQSKSMIALSASGSRFNWLLFFWTFPLACSRF